MGRPVSLRAGSVWVALVGFVAWAFVLAAPLSGSSLLAAAELATVALVVLAVSRTTASIAPAPVAVLLACGNGVTVAAEAGCRVLKARPTDPAHHPLAPRAPGVA